MEHNDNIDGEPTTVPRRGAPERNDVANSMAAGDATEVREPESTDARQEESGEIDITPSAESPPEEPDHGSRAAGAVVGACRLRRTAASGGRQPAVGPGVEGGAPRREPPRLLLLDPFQRLRLHARPDDARAVPVRGDRRGLPGAWRQRLHVAPGVRRGRHRACSNALPAAPAHGQAGRAVRVRHAHRVPGDTVLQPILAQRHTHGRLDARSGGLRLALPGRGQEPLSLRRGRFAGSGVRHKGDGVHHLGSIRHFPARQARTAGAGAHGSAYRGRPHFHTARVVDSGPGHLARHRAVSRRVGHPRGNAAGAARDADTAAVGRDSRAIARHAAPAGQRPGACQPGGISCDRRPDRRRPGDCRPAGRGAAGGVGLRGRTVEVARVVALRGHLLHDMGAVVLHVPDEPGRPPHGSLEIAGLLDSAAGRGARQPALALLLRHHVALRISAAALGAGGRRLLLHSPVYGAFRRCEV